MNFSLYIAKRYLLSKSSHNAINIITIIATIGVVIGSLALFLVLSVFSGLKTFSSSFLNATDADIVITPLKGKSFFWTTGQEAILKKNKDIIAYSKTIEERAFFRHDKKEHIAYIKGVDSNFTKVVRIDSLVYAGKWLDFNKNTSVVGNAISSKLSLGILNYGEPLSILVPKPGKKLIVDPSKAFRILHSQAVGIFSISEEQDNKYVYVPLKSAQQLLQFSNNQISAISIKTSPEKTASVIATLENTLGDKFKIASKEEQNAVFYKILNTEKLVAYLIFTLVLIIALFNVIGSIIMMILDKKKNLQTLYNLGATLKDIQQIFMLQGVLLSLFGLVVGVGLGIALIAAQNSFQLFMITNTIAYPIEFQIKNLAIVCTTIITLGIVASKIASSRISKKVLN
ncbi:ABC transporter permease [Flavicella sediminum]|uniref:ABC transporter permease n=1 Tax=Flavicella sediminum TaxID=2585141 RepID=UPI00111F7D26|nr:ABC transporter permease [Flavicella sediminum]